MNQIDIEKSKANAERHGYIERSFESEHKVFKPLMCKIYNNTKWIHSIEALLRSFGITDLRNYEKLEQENYNVDDYYLYNCEHKDSEHYIHWVAVNNAIDKISDEILDSLPFSINRLSEADDKLKVFEVLQQNKKNLINHYHQESEKKIMEGYKHLIFSTNKKNQVVTECLSKLFLRINSDEDQDLIKCIADISKTSGMVYAYDLYLKVKKVL